MPRSPLLLLLLMLPSLTAASPVRVSATPPRVLLGRDERVELQVQAPPGTAPLRAAASVGTLIPSPDTNRTTRTYHWKPPDVRYPLLAVLAFWVDTPDGPPEVTTLHIPLLGRTTLDIATVPGAEVVVQIGEERFGPVLADPQGNAQVPVEVPPGLAEAHVLATAGGQQTQRTVPLDVPPERPLVAVLSPAPLTREGGWLLLLEREPVPASALALKLQGAGVGVVEAARSLYRVLPHPGASAVTVEARWRSGQGAARITVPVVEPSVAQAPTPEMPEPRSLSFHVLGGGFFAGGGNVGPAVAVGAALWLPRLERRFAVEVELGLRHATLESYVDALGMLRSRVLAVPALVSARARMLEHGPLAVDARAGTGVMPFAHTVSTDFQPTLAQHKLGVMGFLAVQGVYRFGALSALLELRGAYGPARTPQLNAQVGGVSAAVGVRYAP